MLHHRIIDFFQHRWEWLPPLLRLPIVLLSLGGLGLLTVPPIKRQMQSWKQERALRSALTAVASERMEAARDFSLTALQAGDSRVEAFRILERAMSQLRDPRHLEVARSLLEHPDADAQDRTLAFARMCQALPLGVLGRVWSERSAEEQARPAMAAAFAERLLAEDRTEEAAGVLLAVPPEQRDEPVARLLVRILIRSGKAEGYREAQRRIAARAADGGGELPQAWRDLLREIPVGVLSRQEFRPWLGRMARQMAGLSGEAAGELAMLQARFDYAEDHAGRLALLQWVVERWKSEAPLALNSFLNELGMHQRRAEILADPPPRERPACFEPLLEAWMLTRQWESAARLLRDFPQQPDAITWNAHQAIVAGHRKEPTRQAEAWTKALADAKISNEPDRLLRLARLCERLGADDLAQEAWIEAILKGNGPLPLYTRLRPLLGRLAAQGREPILLQILAVYLPMEPTNIVLLTQYAYLACLNEFVAGGPILEALEPMAREFPGESPIRFTLATAHLCDGRPEDAWKVLAPLAENPAALAPGYRALVLAARLLTQQIPADDPLLRQFPWNELLPSERRRLEAWILQAKQPVRGIR